MNIFYGEINVYPHRIYIIIELAALINSMLIDFEIRPVYWIDHDYIRKKGINYKYINLVKKYIPDVKFYEGTLKLNDNKIDAILVHKHQTIKDVINHSEIGNLLGYTCVDDYVKRKHNNYNPILLCKIKYDNEEFYLDLFSYACHTLTDAKKGKKYETKANQVLPSIKEKYKKVFQHFKFEIIEFLFVVNTLK